MNIISKENYFVNLFKIFKFRAYDIERTANESSSWWSSLTTFVSIILIDQLVYPNA
jgi:hypothetical protein